MPEPRPRRTSVKPTSSAEKATVAAKAAPRSRAAAPKSTAATTTTTTKPTTKKRAAPEAEPIEEGDEDDVEEEKEKPAKRARSSSKKDLNDAKEEVAPAKKTRGKTPVPNGTTNGAAKTRGKTPQPNGTSNGTTKKVTKAASVKDAAGSSQKSNGSSRALGRKGTSLSSIPLEKYNHVPAPSEPYRPALNLFVWGAGNFGQFGAGPDDLGEKNKPKRNPWVDEKIKEGAFGKDSAGFVGVSAGGLHTLFVDENGAVWSCGVNDDAALGRNTTDVPDPADPSKFLDVDELTAWPHPIQSLVDEGFRAVRVAAGDNISAAISAEGDLRVWGSFRANEGQLGFSSGLKHQLEPIDILGAKLHHGEKVTAVAPGANHLVVLTTAGHIYTWGAGEQGQLGRRIIERRKINGTSPERITLGTNSRKAKLIGTGNYHSFAVDEDGDVWAWGLNSMGQTGTGRTRESDAEVPSPVVVRALMKKTLSEGDEEDEVVDIQGGEHHTLFLTRKGRVYACGRADGGQLGLGDDHAALEKNKDFVGEPTRVIVPDEEEDPVVLIGVGLHNNLAVTRDGALYGWGQGPQGELGLGDEEEVNEPTVIVRRSGGAFKAVKVSCGGQHTVGLFQRKAAA